MRLACHHRRRLGAHPSRSVAFTLIELLIVVAIIAILAAIAVPNMIEAQERAKVSRVRADQRTIATAIESYRTDHNQYPPSQNTHTPRVVASRLSTPVAYLTQVPPDAFPRGDNRFNHSDPEGWEFYMRFYTRLDTDRDFGAGAWTSPTGRGLEGSEWGLYSRGPDIDFNWDISSIPITIRNPQRTDYDPTNGTASYGDIHRFGP